MTKAYSRMNKCKRWVCSHRYTVCAWSGLGLRLENTDCVCVCCQGYWRRPVERGDLGRRVQDYDDVRTEIVPATTVASRSFRPVQIRHDTVVLRSIDDHVTHHWLQQPVTASCARCTAACHVHKAAFLYSYFCMSSANILNMYIRWTDMT